MLSSLQIQVKRIIRRLIWPHPALYAPFGILRNRGNVFEPIELYISGFPRSGNTFAARAFRSANPGINLGSHRHIPSFVIRALKKELPGMVLLRNPIDAAISWAIYTNHTLRQTLAYYNDYHSVLLPYRDKLFVVMFDDIISDFGKVISEFNSHWKTGYVPFQHTPENVARCLSEIEAEYAHADGKVNEAKVPRPSAQRKAIKEVFLRQIHRSSGWQKELYRANELYQIFAPRKFRPANPAHKTTTTQSIRFRPA